MLRLARVLNYGNSLRTIVIGLVLALLLAGCGSVQKPPEEANHPTDDIAPIDDGPRALPVESSVNPLAMRGDSHFDVSDLSEDAALWYSRFLEQIMDRSSGFDPISAAGRDDLYHYGRTLQPYVQSVLTVFRMTGDLRLLDHVDEIAEGMRAKLRDEWRDTLNGTDGTRDGYLNWVFRYGNDRTYQGNDLHQINEMKTHAMVAMFAYALELNRDLTSPTGRNYGAHADFWQDYLINHFEAKWRERRGVKTGFPIMIRPHTHTYYSWLTWHYYMGKLTGNTAYTKEANRMADALWSEIRPTSTPSGTAYVWTRSVVSEGGGEAYLHPTTYARYVYGDIVQLHFEGFHNWASNEHMTRFARTFTELITDTSNPLKNGFASDIGGGKTRAGLTSDPSWSRMTIDRFRGSSYALIAAWDTSDRLTAITRDIHTALSSSDTTHLATGLFVDSTFSPTSILSAVAP